MMLSSVVFAQFGGLDVEGIISNPNNYLGQQQKEIKNAIMPELEAQAKAQAMKDLEKRRQNQGQMQTGQNRAQVARQQSIENYNNRMSAQGQQRMEYYNNPDNYIDRSVTNRSTSAIIPDERYYEQSQSTDLRTKPVHSENLNSKSLQTLREANREYFSKEEGKYTIDPDARVPLFDAPSLEEYKQKENINYFDEFLIERAMERAKTDALKNMVACKNDMVEMTKKGLGIVGGIVTKGMMSAGALVSANLNLYSELVKYWNECSSGTRVAKTSDTFEILGKATLNTAVDVIMPWAGDKVGGAYLGMENAGRPLWDMLNSAQIGYSLQNFAVSNEKQTK